MKKVLIIVGSVRKQSFNAQLAEVAARTMEGKADVEFLCYDDVPLINQDFEYPAPEPVARVRRAVKAADALWFFTPEYNHSYPGVLKNLVDWLSRPVQPGDYSSAVIKGKKAAICGVSGRSAAAFSRAKLAELLTYIGAETVETQVGMAVNPEAWTSNVLTVPEEVEAELKTLAVKVLA